MAGRQHARESGESEKMHKFKSATVVSNPHKPKAEELRREVSAFLEKHGLELSSEGDFLVTVGGDGTILWNKESWRKPIFAIGTVTSFICQATNLDWKEKLGAVLEGEFIIDERAMLASELDGKKLPDSLNEVAIRNTEHRILTVRLEVEGRRHIFRADGILFSTPTGSSAYCYSCGGEELGPKTAAYQIVGIAPFRRAFHPLVVSDSSPSLLEIEAQCKWSIAIDGQFILSLEAGKHKLKICKGGRKVSFLKAKKK